MTKQKTGYFAMRIAPHDRAIIQELARRLRRTESDALRYIAQEVVYAMRAEDERAARLSPVNIPQPAEQPAQAVTAQ